MFTTYVGMVSAINKKQNFIKMDVQKEISLRNAISYCIENNDVNTATNRIMEFIRDEKEALTIPYMVMIS